MWRNNRTKKVKVKVVYFKFQAKEQKHGIFFFLPRWLALWLYSKRVLGSDRDLSVELVYTFLPCYTSVFVRMTR